MSNSEIYVYRTNTGVHQMPPKLDRRQVQDQHSKRVSKARRMHCIYSKVMTSPEIRTKSGVLHDLEHHLGLLFRVAR